MAHTAQAMQSTFTPSVASLLDRGFIQAIAHVRGGREKGDRWPKVDCSTNATPSRISSP